MLGSFKVQAFLATKDAARALPFYRDVLGLTFVADEQPALVFDAGGTQLRVQKVKEHTPYSYTSLGWIVPDITAAVRGLRDRGVKFEIYGFFPQDELGIWTTPGARVAWFKDPDGNLLSLAQLG